LLKKAFAIVAKDMRVEFRTRYAINALLMFLLVSIAAVSVVVAEIELTPVLHAALLWLALFFSSMTGIAHSFVREEDGRTAPLLRLSAAGEVVFWGKFLVNLLILVMAAIIALPLYCLLMNIEFGSLEVHALGLGLGVIGLSGATTIVSAIVSQASARAALFTALSFPLLLPLIILSIEISTAAFAGGTIADVEMPLMLLFSYAGVMITASTMLFDYVWR